VPLSEHEQRLLEQMERALYAEDPKFATSLRSASAGRASRGRAALGVLVLLGGVTLLMLGAILPMIALGVVGFLVMIVGATLVYLGLRGRPAAAATAEGEAAPEASAGAAPRRAPKQAPGFMNRIEDRWRKRRDEGPQQ
jgi:fatty acid desaturase